MWNLMLLFGLASSPSIDALHGMCYGNGVDGKPCTLRTQKYGTRYVYVDGEIHKFRPVFWNVYELTVDRDPRSPAYCNVENHNHYCLNALTFISNQ